MSHVATRPFLRIAPNLVRTLASVCAVLLSSSAVAVDWQKIATRDITLFFPGQMSWEKTLSAGAHKGAKEIREGQRCQECHADEEAELGATQAKASGYAGRNSVIVQLRAAIEGETLLWQISGPTVDGKAPAVAILLGNSALKSSAQAGCWAACHDDAPHMASDQGLKLGKYLSRSRIKSTATGGGAGIRPQAELDAALVAGEFLEFMELKASGEVERGYILDKLHEHDVANAGTMSVTGDRWVAELQRPLAAAQAGEIVLEKAAIYYFGVAIHDPGTEGPDHLVSLAQSLAIGSGTADVVAAVAQ